MKSTAVDSSKIRILVLICLLILNPSFAQTNPVGNWLEDEAGLPCFAYTGTVPFESNTKDGSNARLPVDPWFLLGNYRMTLFTHVSGDYELITGQRAWGRLNQGDGPNSGLNSSSIDLLGATGKPAKSYQLTGTNSLAGNAGSCTRVFGCGFAAYIYQTDEFTCKRVLSVKPSTTPRDGVAAFLLTVTITNKTDKPLNLAWNESVTAHYEMMQQQGAPASQRKVIYSNTVNVQEDRQLIKAEIKASTADPLQFQTRDESSLLDGFPPSLYVKVVTPGLHPELTSQKDGDKDKLNSRIEFLLKPGEKQQIEWIVGFSFDPALGAIDKNCQSMLEKTASPAGKPDSFRSEAAYSGQWLKVLPKFEKESDATLKWELVWHAYNLEAMATYSEYYNETKIPQGTVYNYGWGIDGNARDNFQHALPLCYYNPALAKSVLKYMMKRTTPSGEIKMIQLGNGYCSNQNFFPSDQQLYYFQLLTEYVRVTGDYDFLLELSECYPAKRMPRANSLDVIDRCFRFLRDEIGTGPHGLVRLMNSDWNSEIYSMMKEPYNRAVNSGESHMNSAMAIKVLGDLIAMLDSAQTQSSFISAQTQIKAITQSMALFRKGVLEGFTNDLGTRSFSRRMYFAGKPYGTENMFLEPQGYMLQMKEISVENKKALYEEIKQRLFSGEKLGAREQQVPEFEDSQWGKGSRENGGFWYALNGPLILGVAQFDKVEAKRLLKNMSFDNSAKCFPNYWSSYWSAPDSLDSSLLPTEGLPVQNAKAYAAIPVYCAHPHAWILYCYYTINR